MAKRTKQNYEFSRRTSQWVLNNLWKKDLLELQKHLQQINLIAKNSGIWDCQRTGFFKQTMEFEKQVQKAIKENKYETFVFERLKKGK
jgi:hypothetical protein